MIEETNIEKCREVIGGEVNNYNNMEEDRAIGNMLCVEEGKRSFFITENRIADYNMRDK